MDNSLLASIQKGKKLKKAQTNDRSAPTVGGGVIENGKKAESASARAAPAAESSEPRLGGLFAGGMPKLRPSGSRAAVPGKSAAPPPAVSRPAPPPIPKLKTGSAPPPPPAPFAAALKKPSVNAPAPPAAPVVRRPAPPPSNVDRATNGISRMSVNQQEPPRAPFSAANLRKTGIDMTRQAPQPPPMAAAQPKAPVVSRPPPRPPQSPRMENVSVPSSTGIGSVNGRWTFPADNQLPPPPPFKGTEKVYPSGRTTGTTVMPTHAPIVVAPKAPKNSASMPKKPMGTPAPAKASMATGVSPSMIIEEKIQSLNRDLKTAVANEEFEQCSGIRDRIKKLRQLKDDADQGFDISPAEINAV